MSIFLVCSVGFPLSLLGSLLGPPGDPVLLLVAGKGLPSLFGWGGAPRHPPDSGRAPLVLLWEPTPPPRPGGGTSGLPSYPRRGTLLWDVDV